MDATEEVCENTCQYAFDGDCDDGGPNSDYSLCDCGTDCADCGTREVSDNDCLGGASSSSSSSGSSSSGSSSSSSSGSSSSSSGSSSSSSGGSSSSSSGGGFTGASLTNSSYAFPNINNCDVPGFSDNGSQVHVTVSYNLDGGSGPIDPSEVSARWEVEFSGGNTGSGSGQNLYNVSSNSFDLRWCIVFGSDSYADYDFRLWSGGEPVSNTRSIRVYRPSGGN